jgi:FdhD protein
VSGTSVSPDRDAVAAERPLDIHINGDPFAVVMRTPGDDRHLAAGFLFTEGVIESADDLGAMTLDEPLDILHVTMPPSSAARVSDRLRERRQTVINASCGLCGRRPAASTLSAGPAFRERLTIRRADVLQWPARLRARQPAFADTGGLHAAALFSAAGDLLADAEDIGRHNAVDKIIGHMLIDRRLPLHTNALFVSGRSSFEIVQKAWLAGIPIVAAVSAPSSLAVELADAAGMTLVGFVRDDRFNIYAGAARIDA